jgi:hypothetical protein
MNNIKILVFTKYDKKGASSRLRSMQYFKGIKEAGVEIERSPLFDDSYFLGCPSGFLKVKCGNFNRNL